MNYFQRSKELNHEIEITRLKVEAARAGLELNKEIANIRAIVDEGNNIRNNDVELDGGEFINTLRASVRPIITYTIFGIFVGVKLCVACIILISGEINITTMKLAMDAILDEHTMAITSTVIGYYFGARALERFGETNKTNNITSPTNTLTKFELTK